ncbi:MAG: hypothetical protein IJ413_02355 [Bacteroides sp.]|nr:hypothetical protein [Bacteroides sp.]
MMKSLFTTQQWETAKPADVVYDHFFYSEREPGKVLVVHGFVKTNKRVQLSNGRSSRKPCYRKAIWNGSGHCRIGSYLVREHKYDIPLKG